MPLARSRLLPQVLRLLPKWLLAMLDAWSWRVAQAHAERRRQRSR